MESVPIVDRENCCKMDFFSVAKVRKYEVGKRAVIQVLEFHRIHRGCGKTRLGLSEGNPECCIINQLIT